MAANDTQVGGNHYKSMGYQHWDFMTDINAPYLTGCATKYVARHRSKNGREDVLKARHYVEKMQEVYGDQVPAGWPNWESNMRRFIYENGVPYEEALAIENIVLGNWPVALVYIDLLISQYDQKTATQ